MAALFIPTRFPRRQRKTHRPASRKPLLFVELLEQRQVLTAFTPGDLIVLRAGDGNAYSGTAPLYLDEYDVNGNLIQTVAIPNNEVVGGPGNQPITIDLSAAAGNGQLNRSYDGSVLTFGGDDSGINSITATGSADRVIAMIGNDPAAANFLDTTTHGQFYVGDDNRGAIAESASGPLWTAGHPNQAGGAVSEGVHYFPTLGPSIGTQVSAGANIRGVTIGFDNRLYFSTAGSSQTGLAGIYTEAQPLPTDPDPASDVPVVSALFGASKLGGIYLDDVNGTGVLQNGDRLYFLDDGTVGGASTGGLYVSTYNTAFPGNHWSTAVRLGDGIVADQPNPQPTAQLRGLAGTVISPTETDLYVSQFDNVGGNDSFILKFADTGTGVDIASATEDGNVVTITTMIPNNFTTGQNVVVDGIPAGLGGASIVNDGYNGTWNITVLDSTHFTYTDTNAHGTGLSEVDSQGAADVAVTPSIATSLADGSVTIAGSTYAAEGLRGVAFAPVAPTLVDLAVNGSSSTTVSPGTPVTFVATLSNAQVTPTGVVTFIDQNTNTVLGQGTITTVNGVTSATLTTTLVGNHLVSAYFSGGGTAALASATSTPVTVDEAGSAASAVVVNPSLGAAAVGLPITLTANVTGSGSTPTGTVSFYNGGTDLSNLLGTAPLDATGTATFTASFSTAGTENIIAIYNGDDTYASGQGTTTVTMAPNALATITSSANYVSVGAAPAYTVTLNGNDALGSPAGMVQFFLDGAPLGNAEPLTAGPNNTATASVPSTALSAGSHFVTVAYTAASPYVSFSLDTTTATNGIAYIETAQQPFTPGDLVAVQRGDGTVNLGSSGYLVFLDEYTQAGVLVQKIALPNVDAGNAHGLLLSGQNGAEGLLSRSANGYYLTLAGYDVPVGQQFVTSTFPFQYVRTIARIDLAGDVDTSTTISTASDSSVPYNPLDVVSYDGNEFWLVSNLPVGDTTDSGIEYIDSLGETKAIQIGPVGSTGAALAIAGGQLYAASTDLDPSGTPVGVWQVGTGLPTALASLATLPGLLDAYQAAFPDGQNPKQLLFFNHNDGTSNNPDTLFIADQSNGLLKFYFNGTDWVFGNGSTTNPFGQKLVFSGGATGLAGYVVNPGPNAEFQLYVTGSNVQGQNPNQIDSLLDTNPYNAGFVSGNFSTLAFVGQVGDSPNGNENFAGLAFVPGYQTAAALTSSASSVAAGTPVTFTVAVTAPAGTPTGVVTFYDGTILLGQATLDSTGTATFTVSSLTVGDHAITAFYNGDVADGTSTSEVFTQTVTPPPSPPGGGGAASPGSGGLAIVGLQNQTIPAGTAITSANPTPGANQTPVMTPDNSLNTPAIAKTASFLIHSTGGASVDAIEQLFTAQDGESAAWWSFSLDHESFTGS
jgi:hypothetical protein